MTDIYWCGISVIDRLGRHVAEPLPASRHGFAQSIDAALSRVSLLLVTRLYWNQLPLATGAYVAWSQPIPRTETQDLDTTHKAGVHQPASYLQHANPLISHSFYPSITNPIIPQASAPPTHPTL